MESQKYTVRIESLGWYPIPSIGSPRRDFHPIEEAPKLIQLAVEQVGEWYAREYLGAWPGPINYMVGALYLIKQRKRGKREPYCYDELRRLDSLIGLQSPG